MEETGQRYQETRPLPPPRAALSENEPTLPPLGILTGLSGRSLQNLSCYGRFDEFAPGSVMIKEGDAQDRFYVVVAGELAVTVRSATKTITLSTPHVGDCLGEVNLLEPSTASASVTAVTSATVWSMDITDLRIYLQDHAGGAGAFLMGMASCLAGRLRQANELIRKNHAPPAETLPSGRQRAITATNAPVHIGLFDRLKKTIGGEKKIRISTKIKM